MKEALALAETTRGLTNPDPMVGAIIVKNGKVIGKGCHEKFGQPHAETYAIKEASKEAKDSTLYVTLEPCCHWGNNPPCTSSIIKAGIKRVVIAIRDPNPLVKRGDSISILKNAGIEVQLGVLEQEATKLNEVFIKYITKKRPFTILKIASSLDGKIALHDGSSKWITCTQSRQYVHQLRNEVDATLVGIGTILKDDPLLTSRNIKNKHSSSRRNIRIIIDSFAQTPLTSRIIRSISSKNSTWIAVSTKADKIKIANLEKIGAKIIPISEIQPGILDLKKLMVILGKDQISSLMIEGGSKINTAMLESKLVDKMLYFLAPKIIAEKEAIPAIAGNKLASINKSIKLKDVEYKNIDTDLLVTGYI